MQKILFLFTCLAPVVLFAGCFGAEKPEGMPKLYPVELTVLSEGQPVPNARISLYNKDPSFEWSIGGITNEQGKATLATHGRHLGAPEGEFIVTIEKLEAEEYDQDNPPPTIKVFSYAKTEYTDRDQSPLTITVSKKRKSETIEIGVMKKTVLRVVSPN